MPDPSLVPTLIQGVWQLALPIFVDDRGRFCETYRRTWIPGAREMVQGNLSRSRKGVLRGLHYHRRQADLWTVPQGAVLVGLYDLRRGSRTRGVAQTFALTDSIACGLYIPPGVAHGFYAIEDSLLSYLVDEPYDGTDELGLRWDDPALGINWTWNYGKGRVATPPILSERDARNPLLIDIPAVLLP